MVLRDSKVAILLKLHSDASAARRQQQGGPWQGFCSLLKASKHARQGRQPLLISSTSGITAVRETLLGKLYDDKGGQLPSGL